MNDHTVRLIVTSGEPAGIGPDILIRLACEGALQGVVVLACPLMMAARARLLGVKLELLEYVSGTTPVAKRGRMIILAVTTKSPVVAGTLNPDNAEYVLSQLDIACNTCLQGDFDAMVTAPVSKSIINDAGKPFSGHTEYLADRLGACCPVMLLSCPDLRVALATTHVPLRMVSEALTRPYLRQIIGVLAQDLHTRLGVSDPRILVCGLNPHAGEGGHIGTEEQFIIQPVVQEFIAAGMRLYGPVSADTAFTAVNRQRFDAFLCMYHDQGLPVLKALGFGAAVNITLGLPIIRTSVDHGTALALAGSDKVCSGSLQAAIDMARIIVKNSLSNDVHAQSKAEGLFNNNKTS